MSDVERDARYVAENLLQSNSSNNYYQNEYVQSPNLNISHSQSINTIPSLHPDYVISEDLLAGQRYQGRMSNIRRFFCLFVTFDLLFVGLMWTICVMLNGENIMKALSEQIVHYNIHTSLFDVVLAALCRFVVLLLFYALIYINHWFIISLSTTLTCVFLIAKVFMYDWPHSSQPVFEVLLVLISFVLSWGEAWFLDFRVFPQESHARRYLISNADPERAPLIRRYVQGAPSMYTESVGNFYSPMASPEGSLYRFQSDVVMGRYAPMKLTKEQETAYKAMAASTVQQAWDIYQKNSWKLEKNDGGDQFHTLSIPKVGKVNKLTAEMDISPRYLLDELFYKVEDIPKWNPALLESHKVQIIDEQTDISYQISADWGGGVVSSRDFVTFRHWDFVEDCYIIASQATDHPSIQQNDKYIRGENGIGCFIMRSIPNIKNKCHFEWILNTNLKGWIPQYVLDMAMKEMMYEYIKYLRQHIGKLRETGKLT